MKYKFIEDLKALLIEKQPDLYNQFVRDDVLSPNLIGAALQKEFPECPIGTSNYRSGATLDWLRKHYDQTQD